MSNMLMTLRCFVPQLMEVESSTEGNTTQKLIVLGVVFVAFVVIFILVSKKNEKEKIIERRRLLCKKLRIF